eukprot:scaffold76518_cov45-Phaeocystis_antarctica.AAC.1
MCRAAASSAAAVRGRPCRPVAAAALAAATPARPRRCSRSRGWPRCRAPPRPATLLAAPTPPPG